MHQLIKKYIALPPADYASALDFEAAQCMRGGMWGRVISNANSRYPIIANNGFEGCLAIIAEATNLDGSPDEVRGVGIDHTPDR